MYNKKRANKLLDEINLPKDLRNLDIKQLSQVSDELRAEVIDVVSKTGGHLGAGLGVVELTVALHYVFDTPNDLLIWDIGHQAYPHKILTGRKDQMSTLRIAGGLSGFLKRDESKYDTFGAGHSSTSISAALGMKVGCNINGVSKKVIAVIGDGALTAGMAYEAMNNAAYLNSNLIVILNDNEMSIAPNVGAMNKYLNKLISLKPFIDMRQKARDLLHIMPQSIENIAIKTKQYAKDIINGNNFFEELGFNYLGPIDGHDVKTLVSILQNLKNEHEINKPTLLHVKTQKGKGFKSPIDCHEKFHAIGKFNNLTGIQDKAPDNLPTYTKICGKTLIEMANLDSKVVAITAAMSSGTGINIFEKAHPDKVFDVGIAEQHAVTFAAGLATQNIKPYVAIYSTFMQRAYDQVVHDVAIQKLPVRFLMDRAGLVGADGPTHAGSFDITYLSCLPNIIIMAPACDTEFINMMHLTLNINDQPSAIRYPRGEAHIIEGSDKYQKLNMGKGHIIKLGKKIAILNLGTRLQEIMKADKILQESNIDITIADARFAKPLDYDLIMQLANNHDILITIEEGANGGFGSWVAKFLQDAQMMDSGKLKFRSMCLPDVFIEHDTPYNMYSKAALNHDAIIIKIISLME